MIDGKRFYKTGDIGEQHGKRFILIDRLKFLLKLSQGEWVSPSKIETALETDGWVDFCVIAADPNHPFVIALVNPSDHFYLDCGIERGESGDEFAKEMLGRLRTRAREAKLKPWEIPQKVIILHDVTWNFRSSVFA